MYNGYGYGCTPHKVGGVVQHRFMGTGGGVVRVHCTEGTGVVWVRVPRYEYGQLSPWAIFAELCAKYRITKKYSVGEIDLCTTQAVVSQQGR